jgi:L-asparagine oxygenase
MSQRTSSATTGVRYENAADVDIIDVELPKDVSDAMRDAMEQAVTCSPYDAFERALPQAVHTFHRFVSEPFLAQIERFILDPTSPCALHLHNVPIDSVLPPTPADGQNTDAKKTYASEGSLMGLARVLGHPFAFKEEKKGKLVHQVCPVATSEQKLSNEGSKVNLAMHIENSFSPHLPHYLLLLCLRGDRDHQAMTRLASGRAIAARLSPEHLAAARLPEFKAQCPDSFSLVPGQKAYSEPHAIFSGPKHCEELRMDLPELTQCLTDRAQAAFDAIQEAIAEPGVVIDVDMQPGDALIVSNRRMTHGRTVFTPKYDGQDRWLQRMYAISDPWLMRGQVDERLRVI